MGTRLNFLSEVAISVVVKDNVLPLQDNSSNPQLLVMDEATSALDFATERELCLNLQKWAKNKRLYYTQTEFYQKF